MPSRRSSLALLLLGTLLSACHESSGGSSFLPPGVTALGFAGDSVEFDGRVVAAPEFENGDDRNGDGDGDDTVLHVLDLATGLETLVPDVALVSGGGGGYFAYTVPEGPGRPDLNGDGDVLDTVLHVIDGRTGAIRNLGLATDFFQAPLQSGTWIAFGVPESSQGGIDLDGDGEDGSVIVHVHDAARRITRALPIGVASQSGSIFLRGSWLVAIGQEDFAFDLNGDGDTSDEVVFTHDLVTGATENLGLALDSFLAFDGRLLVTNLSELSHSGDLNGDGDELDFPVQLVALETGARHIFGNSGQAIVGGGLAFVELAGPGVLLYDEATDEFLQLDELLLRGDPRLAGRHAAMVVEEMLVGDATDGVLFLFDSRTSIVTNTTIAIAGESDAAVFGAFDLDGERSVYLYSAALDRGDGTWPDLVARVRDHASGLERDLGPADQFLLQDGLVVLFVPEQRLGEDRNGDLDENDTILQVHDPVRGSTFDTGLAVLPAFPVEGFPKTLDMDGRQLVLSVPEFLTGHDENGDGDLGDSLVHAVRVP